MNTRRTKRPLLIGTGALAATAALVLGGAVAANAHVSIAEGPVEAGSYSILTFSVPHGCDGARTEVAIQIPEGINAVTPTRNSLYTVEKVARPRHPDHLRQPRQRGHRTRRAGRLHGGDAAPRWAARRVRTLAADPPRTPPTPPVLPCRPASRARPPGCRSRKKAGRPRSGRASPQRRRRPASDAGSHGHGDNTDATVDAHDEDSASAEAPADQTPLVVTSLTVGSIGLIVAVIALLRGRKKA